MHFEGKIVFGIDYTDRRKSNDITSKKRIKSKIKEGQKESE